MTMFEFAHGTVLWSFRLLIVMPLILLVGIMHYAIFPAAVIVGIAACDTAEEFKEMLYDTYVTTPCQIFRELMRT